MFKRALNLLIFIIFTFTMLVFSVLLYVKYLWPAADYEQIMATVKDLTPDVIKTNIYPKDIFFAFLFFIIFWPISGLKLKAKHQLFATLLLVLGTLYFSGFLTYAYYSRKTSTLYEEEYKSPANSAIKFPENKRNLIVIYLESFENNFKEKKHYEENLIKNLSSHQKDGNYAANYHALLGTNYSIAALVASQCAIPLRYDKNRDIWALRYFMPGVICFPEILAQNGYQTEIIKAADIHFTSADIFAKSHGYKKALGVDELKSKYPELNNEKYAGCFGGLSDRTLFEYAKRELNEFDPEHPFLLTLFSLDTHTPSHHKDPQCEKKFNDLRDAYLCTDSIVEGFLSWLEKSPYWQNTTVVILGDHLLPTRIKTDGHPQRGIFNLFLNLPQGLNIDLNKHFSALDIAPSILESIGITLPEHAFGLGRSLFSDTPTLSEKMNRNINIKLMQNSEIYNRFRTPDETRKETFMPYILGQTLTNENLIAYTDAYDNILGTYYLDRLNLLLPDLPTADLKVSLKFQAVTDSGQFILFSANGNEVARYTPKPNEQTPYIIEFTIKKDLITDNKLQLKFRNNKGVSSAVEMGIAPLSLTIDK